MTSLELASLGASHANRRLSGTLSRYNNQIDGVQRQLFPSSEVRQSSEDRIQPTKDQSRVLQS